MRKTRLMLWLPIATLLFPIQAQAQQAGWDGTWVGTTAKGGSIAITIAGESATQYVFRGEDVPVNQSGGKGKSFQLNVGAGHGTVRLTMSGKAKARYSYQGADGGTASAMLMRQ